MRHLLHLLLSAVLVALPRVSVGLELPPGGDEALTVARAVDTALTQNPDLLDALDQTAIAEANLSGVRSTFRPQVAPFYGRTVTRNGSQSDFGLLLNEQLPFGPRISGSLEARTGEEGTSGYTGTASLAVQQPVLKGADPAVTREPLRAALRLKETEGRFLVLRRRQIVVSVWTATLNLVLGEELVRVAHERVDRAERLVAASQAKMEAGTLSRLDVLRAQQQSAVARSQENDSRNARDDAHEALARLLGRPPGSRFLVTPPDRLPVPVPDEETALSHARSSREDLVEQRERVHDAEVALRIAKSFVLPSLDAVAEWRSLGVSSSLGEALAFTTGSSSYNLGFRSQGSLNLGLPLGQKAQAEIGLGTARRAAAIYEDDIARSVSQSVRRLKTARERDAIDQANLQVAEMQLEVANLRFAKGLSDNFNVVDAENLYNSARVSSLTSRQAVLLAEMDLLLVSGLLKPEDFISKK